TTGTLRAPAGWPDENSSGVRTSRYTASGLDRRRSNASGGVVWAMAMFVLLSPPWARSGGGNVPEGRPHVAGWVTIVTRSANAPRSRRVVARGEDAKIFLERRGRPAREGEVLL